jgi:hypothetical protein
LLKMIWVLGFRASWFCIWKFCDNSEVQGFI